MDIIPRNCRKGNHFTVIPVCASCEYNNICAYYINLYIENRVEISKIIDQYVLEHDKYQKGVRFCMEEKKKTKQQKLYVAVVDGEILGKGTSKEIGDDMKGNPKKYPGQVTLLPVTGALKAIATIEIKPAKLSTKEIAKLVKVTKGAL